LYSLYGNITSHGNSYNDFTFELYALYPQFYLVTAFDYFLSATVKIQRGNFKKLLNSLNTTDSDNVSNKVELRIQDDQAQYH
jgi:hypothetical protein